MTFAQKYIQDHPDDDVMKIIDTYCPYDFRYEKKTEKDECTGDCATCWNRKIPTDTPTQPQILDSGNRREFETGAVRDIQEGKGRCDLLPLDVIGDWIESPVINDIALFVETGNVIKLYNVLNDAFGIDIAQNVTTILELAKHFEAGTKKYGERNWQKGIPVRCYIDSAVRHYLKFLRGDQDEPHDRAFVWNIVCAIWTCQHKPELNEYAREEQTDEH